MAKRTLFLIILFALVMALPVGAQEPPQDLAAVMQVLAEGVEVQRAGTAQWIPVRVEAIVGVGDSIRTNADGRAQIIFFADGIETILEPNTAYRIDVFNGDEQAFNLSAALLLGQTQQRLERILDAASSYNVTTPSTSLVARGTAFAVRVEPNGRAAMLVSEGTVDANTDDNSASVPPAFGIRADVESGLSDVVRASSFAELDAALDGCSAVLSTPDDVSINVRLGADTAYPRVGGLAANEVSLLRGVSEDGLWYRVDFRGGFGWILSSSAEITGDCAGLRVFESGYGAEDATLYEFLGDPITLEDLVIPTLPAPTETPTADSDSSEG